MKKLQSAEVTIIGIVFLFGGVSGLLTVVTHFFLLTDVFSIVVYLFSAALFLLLAYAGVLLLRRNEKGLEIGRAVVAMQIINFNIGGIGYLFITGVFVFAGVSDHEASVNAGFDTAFVISLADDAPFVLRFNLLAIAVFLYLSRLLNKVEEELEFQDVIDQFKSKGDAEA